MNRKLVSLNGPRQAGQGPDTGRAVGQSSAPKGLPKLRAGGGWAWRAGQVPAAGPAERGEIFLAQQPEADQEPCKMTDSPGQPVPTALQQKVPSDSETLRSRTKITVKVSSNKNNTSQSRA